MVKINTVREPLFHISKRNTMSNGKIALTYVIASAVALVFSALVFAVLMGVNPFQVIIKIFQGNFSNLDNVEKLLKDASLLLLVGVALVPAFKMKFWNLGGNGQILMGCLISFAVVRYFGNYSKLPSFLIWIIMIVSAVLVGAVWAVIPAIFKSLFNTNESLFTLMMNYIAIELLEYSISVWNPQHPSQAPGIKTPAWLPVLGGKYVLVIISAVILVAFMYLYLNKSKHGFEVSLVGESQNSARYVGISVKKVIIRTVVLSGAICGLVGALLTGAVNHTITSDSANNMGFTAIMVVWFAKCNPLLMIISSFGIIFLQQGVENVLSDFSISNKAAANMLVGLVFFIIIACEFFIIYKINLKKKNKEKEGGFISETKTEKEGK